MINDTRIQVIKPFRVEFYGLSKDTKPNIYLVSFVWQNDDPDALTEGFKEYITTVSFDTLLDDIIKKEEVGYIGDDVYDLSILKMVKYPMCPEDAVRDVTELCEEGGYVIPCKGGRGVVKNLYYENQWFLKTSWKK